MLLPRGVALRTPQTPCSSLTPRGSRRPEIAGSANTHAEKSWYGFKQVAAPWQREGKSEGIKPPWDLCDDLVYPHDMERNLKSGFWQGIIVYY